MRALARRHEGAVGEYHIGGEEVVDGQAEAAREVANSAAERQAGHAGGGEEAGRSGHAEADCGVVDIAPGAAGVGADGVILRADRGAAQQRQVDDQGVIPDSQPCRVVTAASDGDLDAMLAAETYAGNNVGDVPAARDGGRALVDHGVVDYAHLVVPGIARRDQVTAQGSGQLFVRRDGGFR